MQALRAAALLRKSGRVGGDSLVTDVAALGRLGRACRVLRAMTRVSLVPASYVFLRRSGAVLLQLRQNTGYMDGYWTAGAAGHVELGETAVDAAVREAKEELGVDVDRADMIASSVMQRTDGTAEPREQRVDWFFVCDAWRGEPTILEPHKCAELAWFDLDELPERVPDYETLALDAIRGGRTSTLLSYGF